MKKHVLVLVYSQTGQLKQMANNLAKPWLEQTDFEVDIYEYQPQNDYPFPWSSDAFFDAFPESRLGITCPMKAFEPPHQNYDLVVLAYQVWYLSPSIPVWSLLNDRAFKSFIQNKTVVTLLGVRNMWVQAHYQVQKQLRQSGAMHVGQIVMTDPAPNLVSVYTVILWLIGGKQGPNGIWPRSGVPEQRIAELPKLGGLIQEALIQNQFDALQSRIVENKGVDISFVLKTIEFNGYRIFGVWAKLIRKIGQAGDKRRLWAIHVFKYYLLVMIYIIAPIPSVLFWLIGKIFYFPLKAHLKSIQLLK